MVSLNSPDNQEDAEKLDNLDNLESLEKPDNPEKKANDSDEALADSAAQDPHNREYYLAQIPFTEEQMAASHDAIKDGLYHAGIIIKDKLDNLQLGEKMLTRLTTNYPDYKANGRYCSTTPTSSRTSASASISRTPSMLPPTMPSRQTATSSSRPTHSCQPTASRKASTVRSSSSSRA